MTSLRWSSFTDTLFMVDLTLRVWVVRLSGCMLKIVWIPLDWAFQCAMVLGWYFLSWINSWPSYWSPKETAWQMKRCTSHVCFGLDDMLYLSKTCLAAEQFLLVHVHRFLPCQIDKSRLPGPATCLSLLLSNWWTKLGPGGEVRRTLLACSVECFLTVTKTLPSSPSQRVCVLSYYRQDWPCLAIGCEQIVLLSIIPHYAHKRERLLTAVLRSVSESIDGVARLRCD